MRALAVNADEFNEVARIGHFIEKLKMDSSWRASILPSTYLLKTAGGPNHFLGRRRSHGNHQDGAYGWSRHGSIYLELYHLESGHFEAFRSRSSSLGIVRTVSRLLH